MKKNEANISIQMLRSLIFLDSSTGSLYWKPREELFFSKDTDRTRVASMNAWNAKNAGKAAFTARHNKYLCGAIFGKKHFAHRVVFALYYGQWPRFEVDHIDGNGINNIPNNLRDVNRVENARNSSISSKNTSGFTGVSFCKSRNSYEAYIQGSGRQFLGYFKSITDAVRARKSAEIANGYHENHGRKM